jgi:hypothetical protein
MPRLPFPFPRLPVSGLQSKLPRASRRQVHCGAPPGTSSLSTCSAKNTASTSKRPNQCSKAVQANLSLSAKKAGLDATTTNAAGLCAPPASDPQLCSSSGSSALAGDARLLAGVAQGAEEGRQIDAKGQLDVQRALQLGNAGVSARKWWSRVVC